MNQIKISFVVAIYNVEQYLEKCLESLNALKRDDIEILLINDGSSDNSGKICDKYAEKNERMRVFHQENQGVSVARNTGIENARGKWICFIDGDDYIVPETYDWIIENSDESAQIAYFLFDRLNKGKIEKTPENDKRVEYLDNDKENPLCLSVLNPDAGAFGKYQGTFNIVTPWAKLYNAEFLRENNLTYDKDAIRGQDGLFNFIVLKKVTKVQLLYLEGYVYRKSEVAISHKFNPAMLDYSMILINKFRVLVDIKNENEKQMFADYSAKLLYNLLRTNFCHADNPKKYKRRKKDFLKVRNSPVFKFAFDNLGLKNFKIFRRIILWLCKNKVFFVLNFYFRNQKLVLGVNRIFSKLGFR